MNGKIIIKNQEEIGLMKKTGFMMAKVKKDIFDFVDIGRNAWEVENLACKLIEKVGGKPSFKMVPGYSWATCINVNQGIVHGIPTKSIVFKKGDIVSVDCGIFSDGFHSDTSFSKGLETDNEKSMFVLAGKTALKKAIAKAVPGNRIWDISEQIEKTIRGFGYYPIKGLVGHGVGRSLHEPPEIPCLLYGSREKSPIIFEGFVIAIEVMYAMGDADLKLEKDGWTISTSDDTISGLFEDTVAVTSKGPLILTDLG
jgi:methionyl aminopeptidase